MLSRLGGACASRRLLELQAKGKMLTYEQVLAGIRERDHIDSHRKAAPLRPADDAVMFDTTTLTVGAMFSEVETLVDDRQEPRTFWGAEPWHGLTSTS